MRELLGWGGERAAYMAGQGEDKTGQPGNALSIVPSTKKVGPPGCTLDVPLTHINASYVRSHYTEHLLRALRRAGGPTDLRIFAETEA